MRPLDELIENVKSKDTKTAYDFRGASERGEIAEIAFLTSFYNRIQYPDSWDILISNKREDTYEHWDFKVFHDSELLMVFDVKNNMSYDGYVWLELLNVKGNLGSLVGSKATHFAFNVGDHYTCERFIICDRQKLYDETVDKIDQSKPLVRSKPDMPYVRYRRHNRHDDIYKVPISDIIKMGKEWIT